jgi:DNA polymerase I-like protein with 3'-5' exonuclease and polymerase domains
VRKTEEESEEIDSRDENNIPFENADGMDPDVPEKPEQLRDESMLHLLHVYVKSVKDRILEFESTGHSSIQPNEDDLQMLFLAEKLILKYNALDTHYTAWVFLQWIMEAPEWAKKNYLLEFPVIHPNFLMESTGLLVDMEAFKDVLEEHSDKKVSALMEVRANIGEPNFNPGSPPQTFKLMTVLGCGDLKKADDKALNRAAYRHPFNHYIIELILKYRKAAKLVSTYLVETKIFNGRVLYSISPTTVTGRNASSAHAFWTGLNIQNIP